MGPITADLQQGQSPALPGAFFVSTKFRCCRPVPYNAVLADVAEGLAPENIGGARLVAANGPQHRRGSGPVPLRRPDTGKVLVASWVGVVSALSRVIGSIGSISSDSSRADAYCHSAAYGCSTIDTSSIDSPPVDATAIDARATNASAIREGVS